MKTVTLPVNPQSPEPEPIERAAALLRGGGLVAFPTETVYGLGAHALDAAAVARVFEAKGRPAHNPLIVHVATVADARQVAAEWPGAAARLAGHFWPGPLTLVLPRRPEVPNVVTGGGATVAVRVPDHPLALALLRAAGLPVAAPSANRSNRLSPTRAEHVLHDLGGRIDLVLDGGPTPGGIESTVLDLTGTPPRLLRPGLIDVPTLEAVVGPLVRGPRPSAASTGILPAPGMLAQHYAPRTPLECAEDGGRERVDALTRTGCRVAWLCFSLPTGPDPEGVVVRALPGEPAGYAANLYAVLHELDAAGVDRIVVSLPPESEAWRAVRDRLLRAAGRE